MLALIFFFLCSRSMLWTMILILWLWQKHGCDLEIPMTLKWELCVLPAIGSYMFQDLIPGEEELVCYLKTILISTPQCVTLFSHLNSWMSVSEAFSVLGSWLFNVHPTTTPVCFSLKSSLDY